MKKFIFKLEALLTTRQVREGTLRRELEQTQQKWNQAKEQEGMLSGQIHLLCAEIQQMRARGRIVLQDTYEQILEKLQATLVQVQQTLFLHQKMIQEQKERLKRAILERKVVEKIKEKQYTDWRLREERSDGAFLDDIILKKFSEPK